MAVGAIVFLQSPRSPLAADGCRRHCLPGPPPSAWSARSPGTGDQGDEAAAARAQLPRGVTTHDSRTSGSGTGEWGS
ncbi:hypothetical protein Taro_051537 [Colocasia esculenta]|uniref:Uncharacterized protein n=1 Tax=Colocasia esculenta TaxID=4460 RepID=A0A843XH50_COLES|nr:hypothetical protein [Colocasia esculenta]